MDKCIKFFIGLDAHKDSTSVAAACEAIREPARFVGTIGPGLYRELCQRGYQCEIVVPSLIPRRPGDRVKNDRRDCARLAELSRAGELKPIWVPDEAHEAMRNLWRAREDAVGIYG
jgi:transposase